MSLGESGTRAKLIDPALHACGWTEDLIRREETDRGIDVVEGKPRRRERGRIDYLLRIKVNLNSQPPDKGLEQAKKYGRLNHVPFVFSSNGHLYVEYDSLTGKTSSPRPIAEFPPPAELRRRYESHLGVSLDAKKAMALLMTYIAVHLLKKIADAGQLRRALFVCDRDELRSQGLGAFQNVFGADAAEVISSNPQKNARILIATYQTLNVAGEEEEGKFFLDNYPENYFSHIIIDECRRSAWGKWSIVLRRNPDAIQVGLTATPRSFVGGSEAERREDEEITANNLAYFGEPVYEYDMAQGIEDGYLPACEIIRRKTDLDERGISPEDLKDKQVRDAYTGEPILVTHTRGHYEAPSFEDLIQLPDRVKAWCRDLFDLFVETGGPLQKTVIFCVRDTHADAVAAELNNLYADWCQKNSQKRLEPYAFKCTATVGGSQYIADLRGSMRSHMIATTVDLITTGVDVPVLRNVIFFKYVRSPISFQQMMGRGSRIDLPTNKLMFRVYDYTNATRLLGKGFKVRPSPTREPAEPEAERKERIIRVEGFQVRVNPAGKYIVVQKEGKLTMVSVEEYSQMIASRLTKEVRTVDALRECWIDPKRRKEPIDFLPEDGRGLRLLRELLNQQDYDLYDVLAEIGYGIAPKNRKERVSALGYKHRAWLRDLPEKTRSTLIALARQFEKGGTDELENPHVLDAPDVIKAGGLEALKVLGEPKDIIVETKRRLFAA
jgi:type I restriction enzyme R subunit